MGQQHYPVSGAMPPTTAGFADGGCGESSVPCSVGSEHGTPRVVIRDGLQRRISGEENTVASLRFARNTLGPSDHCSGARSRSRRTGILRSYYYHDTEPRYLEAHCAPIGPQACMQRSPQCVSSHSQRRTQVCVSLRHGRPFAAVRKQIINLRSPQTHTA
ncbi:Piso0_001520 [Millerozyma farinosa CBS 7064]|uniref:Piso0_001520 protein n=1 Tax=Pichia sorbitophila (strain ATCC MYA-4447 / BCRC 22081 / CBS 7064 / NBRC 10061 / NRRL Y-12695) TaxID=559304 RepID=G8YL07_PICSO|nr:Piso0_001520 [Millerozyma farinosa CBS 7064]